MSVSADQVRAATSAAAAVITADKMPPLRLRLDGDPGLARRARRAWIAPLAVAAAVIIVVAGSVAAGSWLARGRSGDSGAAEAAGSAFGGVPAYYVAVESASLAVVRATATGAILARITTRTPFVGVTGAADDRTFVLDAQRQIIGHTVRWPGHPEFYLLRLSSAGAEQSFTRLTIPPPPEGTAVTGLALSPDGSKLAVESGTSVNDQPGLLEMRVYTLATGAFRDWSANGSADSEDPSGFTGSGVDGSESISWAADSRTLAFDWQDKSYTGVRLLDTATHGNDLIADSRLAVIEASPGSGRPDPRSKDHVSQCVTDAILSGDGSAVVCGYATTIVHTQAKSNSTTGFVRYSTRTGKPAVIGVFEFSGQGPGDISVYWTNSTGTILIGGVGSRHGVQVGVIDGDKFTPLPGISGLGAATW